MNLPPPLLKNRPAHTDIRLGMSTLIFALIILTSCAQQTNRGPQGGPKDSAPPKIDTLKSTPNYQTRFSDRKIDLVFDEWIQTRNLISKIIISPPLKFLPRIQSRGKKVSIEFNEEEILKEDATYIFNLGDAVSDFREGNKVDNLTFVFSTGDVIDSLGFSGKVIDAFTGKPVQDVYVMLYDVIQDSVVYKEKPFYFVNSNKDGEFTFQNIRADTFKLFALKDGNLNYTYDKGIEQAGFAESLIFLDETFDSTFTIEVFTEKVENEFSKLISSKDGRIKLVFKNELNVVPEYTFSPELDIALEEMVKDTLVLWFRDTLSTTLYVGEDTIAPILEINDSYRSRKIALARRSLGTITLSPKDSLLLRFTTPLESVIEDSISVTDTLGISIPFVKIIDNKILKISGRWQGDSIVNLLVKPGAISDIHGRSNDSISITFRSAPLEKYGDIIFTIEELDTNFNYVIELKKGTETVSKKLLSGVSSETTTFNTLLPGDYFIIILEDRNGDARWTPGSYDEKRQSERMVTINLDALRENWELQATYNWKTKSQE